MQKEFPWEVVWKNKKRYSKKETRELKARNKFIAFKKMESLDNDLGDILEIGCGNCSFIKKINEENIKFNSYTGVDLSKSALNEAQSNIKKIKNHNLINADVTEVLLDKKFDTIIALGLLEHIEHFEKLKNNILKHSTDGTKIIISTSNKKSMMYLARKTREALGFWPYGYQDNDTITSISKKLGHEFRIVNSTTLHGDNDYFISTLFDKVLSIFSKNIGRYLLIELSVEFKNNESIKNARNN